MSVLLYSFTLFIISKLRGLLCREPEALPFCALAYALIGVISTVLASIPLVSSTIIAIAGAS
jgi:hypothetical protein